MVFSSVLTRSLPVRDSHAVTRAVNRSPVPTKAAGNLGM